MRKRINVRFALYLVLTVAALATGTHFLHGYQVRRNAGSLLDRARHFQEQGDLSKAADYFGQYIGLNPKDIDALAQYGLLLADDQLAKTPQQRSRALATLERVLVREPDRHGVRRRAVQVAMSLGRYPAARDNMGHLEEAFPKDPEVVQMFARCLEAVNDLKGARGKYERAIVLAPHNLDAYARLATLLRRHTKDVLNDKETAKKETEKDAKKLADEVMKAMVAANVDSYRAYLLCAEYLRIFPEAAGPDLGTVATNLKEAENRAPDSAEVLLALADLAIMQDQPHEARKRLQDCRKLHPKEWRSYQALARLDAMHGKTEEALACLDQGLAQVPDRTELHWDRAKLLAAAGRADDAQKSIELLSRSGFPAADLDVLRGRVMMQDERQAERWTKAINLLEEAYEALVTRADRRKDETAGAWAEQAALWLAECNEQVGKVGRAHTVYSRVVARDSRSIPGRIGVATTLWAQGRLQDALDQYRLLMRVLPEPQRPAWVYAEVARLALLVNLEREELRRNWAELEDALLDAERLEPLPPSVAILRAEYLAYREKFDEAQKSLETRYDDRMSRPAAIWAALVSLKEWQGHEWEAFDYLEDARRLCDDAVELRLARAGFIVRRSDGHVRDALLALADHVDEFLVADRCRLYRGLAAVCGQAKLTAEAKDLWQRVTKELPKDLQSHVALFELAVQAGAVDVGMERWQKEIRGIEKEIREIEGEDGVMWRNARISALLTDAARRDDLSRLPEARSLLAAMTARRPDWPRVPLTAARINDLEKRPDDALPLYMRAIQLGERDPAALVRTFNLLVERGRVDEANRIARLLPNPSSSGHDNQRVIGEVALRANDLGRAQQLADGVVTAAKNDYRSYLLRGQTHWAAGRPDAALEDYREACKLAPAEPTTWLNLVQFLVANKSMQEEARSAANAAEGKLTGPKGLSALARINSLVGRADRAAELFHQAIAAAGDDADVLGSAALHYLSSGRQKEADDLLERLSKNPDRKWAAQALYLRRVLALAGRGSPDALKEALAHIDSPGVDAAGLSAAEKVQQQRSRAQLLALQPSRSRRREAVRILEDLIDRKLATPADHLLAAQLYEAIDDFGKARVRYAALLTLPGGDAPAILAAAGQFFVRHADLDAAALALRGLEAQPRQVAAATVLRARLYHAQNQTPKAVDLLLALADANGTDRSAVAGVLEELGQFREAEKQLRKFVDASKRPEDVLTVAHFLIRRKRFAEALDLCDGAWQNCQPAAVADTSLAVLAEMPSNPSAFARVAARVDAARLKSPNDSMLLAALAAVRNFQGQFDEAVNLYGRILAKEPNHAAALNNLAWLLALKGGNANEAVDLVNRAAQVTGPNPNLLDTRAVAYLALKQPAAADRAVKDLDEVIAEAPSPTAYFHLAQAHLMAGRRKEALQAWRKANEGTRLSPESLHPLERTALARLAEDLGPPT